MAAKSLSYFLVILFLNNIISHIVHVKLIEINKTDVQEMADLKFNETGVTTKTDLNVNVTGDDIRAHLKYKSVLDACNNKRDEICTPFDDPHICTMRIYKNNTQYKDFDSACYLFMSNMCDNPGEEFLIIRKGTCEEYLQSRRNNDNEQNVTRTVENDEQNVTRTVENDEQNITQTIENADSVDNSSGIDTTPNILRAKTTEKRLLYVNGQECPFSCPNIYEPTCINANRYYGLYFKFMTFVNKCEAYIYYCEHSSEFAIPNSTPEPSFAWLSWSYCGASKFMQFARFSEVASSLGHYGWLKGNYGPRHIMEPHQRIPGYG